MSTFIKKLNFIFLVSLSCFFLSGCETLNIEVAESPRTKLEIDIPPPLELNQVDWKVIKYEDVVYFALTSNEFTDLSLNIEAAQNRLYTYHEIIDQQQKYYEKID